MEEFFMSRNFQTTKINTKKQPPKPTILKLGFALPEGTPDSVIEEILEVIRNAQFDKISVPVSTYRYILDPSIPTDDTRVLTIGYIKDYDPEEEEFTIVVYRANFDTISAIDNPVLEIVFNSYNDKLGVITKFNVIPYVPAEPANEETEPVE